MKRLFTFLLILPFYWTAQAQLGPGVVWSETYGGDDGDAGYSVVQKSDSSYVIFGNAGSNDNGNVPPNHGNTDLWMIWASKQGVLNSSKCYGGSSVETGTKMLPLSDGGYMLLGSASSTDGDVSGYHGGGSDFWVVRLDDTGAIVWQRCLGGTGNDYPYGMDTTRDGGVIVCGYTQSNDGDVSGNHGNTDAWVVKLDANGHIDWQRCLGGSNGDMAYAVKSTPDGGYIVGAVTGSNDGDVSGSHGGGDAWMVKLDANGNIQWQKCYGGAASDGFNAIFALPDGSYIASGTTNSTDGDVSGYHGGSGNDVWVVRADHNGNLAWQRCLGGTRNEYTQGIFVDRDGDILVAGVTWSPDGDIHNYHGGSGDGWVIKLNTNGQVAWQRCYGGSGEDKLYEIHPDLNGGYYIVGYSSSRDGDVYARWGRLDVWLGQLSGVNGLDDVVSVIGTIRVYPTLTHGMVFLNVPVAIEQYSLTLYNPLGQQVTLPVTGTGTERQLHFDGLPAGMYLLRIAIGNQSHTYKISYLP